MWSLSSLILLMVYQTSKAQSEASQARLYSWCIRQVGKHISPKWSLSSLTLLMVYQTIKAQSEASQARFYSWCIRQVSKHISTKWSLSSLTLLKVYQTSIQTHKPKVKPLKQGLLMVYQKSVQTLKTHSEGFQAFQPALAFHSQKVNFVKNIKTLKPQQFRLQKYHRQRRSHSSNITEKLLKIKKPSLLMFL